VRPDIALQASAPGTVAELATRGLGVAILTASMVDDGALRGLEIADLEPACSRSSGETPTHPRCASSCATAARHSHSQRPGHVPAWVASRKWIGVRTSRCCLAMELDRAGGSSPFPRKQASSLALSSLAWDEQRGVIRVRSGGRAERACERPSRANSPRWLARQRRLGTGARPVPKHAGNGRNLRLSIFAAARVSMALYGSLSAPGSAGSSFFTREKTPVDPGSSIERAARAQPGGREIRRCEAVAARRGLRSLAAGITARGG
jgi:hypothetical protein